MKKQFFLPIVLLVSCITLKTMTVAPTSSSDSTLPPTSTGSQNTPTSPTTPTTLPSTSGTGAQTATPAPTTALPTPTTPTAPTTLPSTSGTGAQTVTSAPTATTAPSTPAVSTPTPPTPIPTEDDINKILSLMSAYQTDQAVIKKLHDIATANDVTPTNLPNETLVRSLVNLLKLHNKEADLITSLRASIASLQTSLNKWDNDVAGLITKIQHRHVDFDKVKDLVDKQKPHVR